MDQDTHLTMNVLKTQTAPDGATGRGMAALALPAPDAAPNLTTCLTSNGSLKPALEMRATEPTVHFSGVHDF